jgi:hypothetical protein
MAVPVGLAAAVAIAMWKLNSSWPLVALFLIDVKREEELGPRIKQWFKITRLACVAALCGFGVWLSKSAWPALAVLLAYDWNDEEEAEEPESPSPANISGSCASLPFTSSKLARGVFGSARGLLRLEDDALAIDFEIRSLRAAARAPIREVRVPYREIVLAELDFCHLILRTAHAQALAGLPGSDWGEAKLRVNVFSDVAEAAAKKFATTLGQRIADATKY